MNEYQYATIELRVLRRGPSSAKLPEIFAKEGMYTQAQEVVWVVGLDAMSHLRTIVEVARGNQWNVEVDIATVMQAFLLAGTNRFWLVHNHPSGVVTPTKADINLSKQVNVAAAVHGSFLEDHIIIGPPAEWYSMVGHQHFTPSAGLRRLYAANSPVRLHSKEKR